MNQKRLSDETLQWIFQSSTWIVMGLEPGPSTVGRIPLEEVDEAIREMVRELLERRRDERARTMSVESIALTDTKMERIVITGWRERFIRALRNAITQLGEVSVTEHGIVIYDEDNIQKEVILRVKD